MQAEEKAEVCGQQHQQPQVTHSSSKDNIFLRAGESLHKQYACGLSMHGWKQFSEMYDRNLAAD